jgi:hypothetical protein
MSLGEEMYMVVDWILVRLLDCFWSSNIGSL